MNQQKSSSGSPKIGFGHNSRERSKTNFAIMIAFDNIILQETHKSGSIDDALSDVARALSQIGFPTHSGTTYFGQDVDAVHCVLAFQSLSHRFPWFAPSVISARLLRIEETTDLMPAISR